MSSNAMLNIAVKAARAACTIISRASENLDAIEVHSKAPSDFVSKVDVDCESAIIEILQQAYPHHQILTEERGIVGPYEGSKPRQLLITKQQWQEMQYRQNLPAGSPVVEQTTAEPEQPPFDMEDALDISAQDTL